ncbi:hypothetical protein T459_29554 [Capsicum annuum]|uniref:Retrovirus-related Pol polyprotein from transposon TNT 1-94 n=1 Tax=Capsicum annuum TaxID=4072 RepID=A0A2G2Y608_CAPAN|nr:hypothetical protein T459_29554 [Capsicum annuum]
MYLTATSPDNIYSLSLISRYMESPKEVHLLVKKRTSCYLQVTTNYGLFYAKGEKSDLVGFIDSDYAGDLDDRKSTSGYIFMMGLGEILWSSQNQAM